MTQLTQEAFEQGLRNLATKDDLENLVTKTDLDKRLEILVTKDDLEKRFSDQTAMFLSKLATPRRDPSR